MLWACWCAGTEGGHTPLPPPPREFEFHFLPFSRLTAEDPGLLQIAAAFFQEQLSLVMQTLQHSVPPLLISLSTEEGLKPSLCALASSVLPESIAFCSSLMGLHLVPVLLFGGSVST